MNTSINRALIFQGGGSLGAYEAGAYKAMNEDLSAFFRTKGRENEPLFHIVSGTSIGAINAALLVSYVKENKKWEGSAERLIEFWEYLSTESSVENIPYFMHYWDSWRKLDSRIASGESARRYFTTKEFILKGVPKVFVPKMPLLDSRFFDPLNTWYIYDNRPLKESLEKFAKFPISTSFENNEPRLLLVAVDVQEPLQSFSIVMKRKMEQEKPNTEDTVESNLTVRRKIRRMRHLNTLYYTKMGLTQISF